MITAIATADPESLDWRTIPNWAIPQLAYIRDTLGATILRVFLPLPDYGQPPSGRLGFALRIPNEGRYVGTIYKRDMTDPKHIPSLYG